MICCMSWPRIEQHINWALSLSCVWSRRCFPLLRWSVFSAYQQHTHNWSQVLDCEAWVRGRVGHHVGSHTALVSKLRSFVTTGLQATTNEGDEHDRAPFNLHLFKQMRRMPMRCGWISQWCVSLNECSDRCVMHVVAWRTAWKTGSLIDWILIQQGTLARCSQCI